MSDITSSAGTKVSVSTAKPATLDSAGYSALTYTLVGELSDFSGYGSEAAVASHTPLTSGRVVKRRGSVNDGSQTLSLALSADDAGQVILEGLADSNPGTDAHITVKVELVSGAIHYYLAQVISFMINVGNADAITTAECKIEVNSPTLKVAAA